jgi:hypothetical protein
MWLFRHQGSVGVQAHEELDQLATPRWIGPRQHAVTSRAEIEQLDPRRSVRELVRKPDDDRLLVAGRAAFITTKSVRHRSPSAQPQPVSHTALFHQPPPSRSTRAQGSDLKARAAAQSAHFEGGFRPRGPVYPKAVLAESPLRPAALEQLSRGRGRKQARLTLHEV